MKKIAIVFLLALVFSVAPATSEETYNYTVELVKCSKTPSKRVLSKSAWKSFLKQSGAIVLDSAQGVTQDSAPSLVHEGLKSPISYKDPRADMYQVQYVDLGFKIDITIKRQTDGTLYMLSRGERSVASPIPEQPKRASVVIYESGITMKRGEAAVMASTKGVMNVKYLKSHFPDIPVTESDYLMMVITVD